MRISFFAILFLFSSALNAESITQADQQANIATRLFMDACTANMGDVPKLKAWVQQNKLRPTDTAFSQKVLQGQPGEVWSAANPVGDFLVVFGSPYRCAIWARRANARLAMENFQKLAKGVERPGLSVNLVKDQELQGQGGRYRQIAYKLTRHDSEAGVVMLATITESATAEVQVRLTIGVAK